MGKQEGVQEATEAQLEHALKSRLQHFRDNASSLTLGSIRRLLEEDLGLQQYALDVHKRFIKQFIDKNLVADEDDGPKTTDGGKVEVKSTVEKDKGLSGGSYKDEAEMEDSPIMGVLTTKTEFNSSQGIEINESIIKKAIQEKADYFRSKSETLTLVGSRRYLEEELKLGKNALDPFKKFIRKEIEKAIESVVFPISASVSKKGISGNHQTNTGGSTISEHSENADEDQKEKPREKTIRKGEIEKLVSEKKHKRPKTDAFGKKQTKLAEKQSKESSDADNNVSVSKDSEPQSSAAKPPKKKEVPTPTFGKRVEHLRSVIKACGMSIAPTVYKKAKQEPDSKREAFLIKEMEGILSKEGLSKNPSEKEIKEVRKRKERAKELEGIDMSNIITSSRRRSSMGFLPPPRPKKKDEGEDDALSTKKDKNSGKDATEKEEDDAVKDAKKKEEDVDVKDAKGKGKDADDDDREEEEEEEEEEEGEGKDEGEDEDNSQNEEFNDDDEDSS